MCETQSGCQYISGIDPDDKFCYLGDVLSPNSGAHAAVLATIQCSWNKFRHLAPFLTAKDTSMQI